MLGIFKKKKNILYILQGVCCLQQSKDFKSVIGVYDFIPESWCGAVHEIRWLMYSKQEHQCLVLYVSEHINCSEIYRRNADLGAT